MQITLSTFKKDKVYGILPCDPDLSKKISRHQFINSVKAWAYGYFQQPLSIFEAIEPDLYSLVIVLDINNGHDDLQQVIDIPVV